MTTEVALLTPTSADKSAARRFLDCCYDESLRIPNADSLERLVRLGWLERLPNGYSAETDVLKFTNLFD
ncbi:hypothetical protein [Pseudomonas serbica]|jgi:hypothetical protein|uniref:hypothetical protein n=1 Tax=Pseudomonas serbica TaxID=2965074 RepID=UPI00237B38ED|nr:hypothetical protein [Pseudomonas serbica]